MTYWDLTGVTYDEQGILQKDYQILGTLQTT